MTIDGWIMKTQIENNNVMSRYDHKIETSLEGIEHLSKEKKEKEERKMKEKNHYYNERNSELKRRIQITDLQKQEIEEKQEIRLSKR